MDAGLNRAIQENTMNRRHHLPGLAGLLTTLTLLAGPALASPNGDGAQTFGEPPRDKVEQVAEQLDLDETQVAALTAMQAEVKTSRQAVRSELKTLREELDAELQAEEPNAKAIHKLLDQQHDLRADLAHDKMDAFLDFRATLTPDQRTEFDRLMKQREARKHKARGKHGPDGQSGQDGQLWEQR